MLLMHSGRVKEDREEQEKKSGELGLERDAKDSDRSQ